LWAARASTLSVRAKSLAEILPALADTTAPLFGRETIPPQRAYVPIIREGKVDLGPLTVRPDPSKEAVPPKSP